MKKTTRTALTALTLVGMLALGAAAATVQQQITATLRPDISVTVDGKKQSLTSQDGSEVYAITYNGTTYLPVRAVSEALGKDVTWDQKNQTVVLTTPQTSTGTQTKPSQTTTSTTTYDSRISALDGRVDALEKGTWNWTTYNQLDRDIEALEDEIKADYRSGKLTYDQYKTLDNSLDSVDERLDRLEDLWDDD